MEDSEETVKIKVCIIGAGASGLCAARHLTKNLTKFELKMFEQSADIGGTWVYTDKVGFDDRGLPIHSSMYKNLRTNLPKEIMHFPDFNKIKGNESCVNHDVILDYLKNYAEYFKLYPFIEFNTEVQYIKPEESNRNSFSENWKVTVKNIISSEIKEFIFDAIMICNGHYFNPHIPKIPGLQNFRGQVFHSHDYRKPEHYSGKVVIVLGASSSGVDIAIEICEKASHVYLSHNNKRLHNSNDVISKLTEVTGVDKFENEKFFLKDGSTVKADILLLCTGYDYTFAFLDKSCDIKVDNNYITPLYKHIINIEHPTMCFIGIPFLVLTFPLFHMQVQYFISLLKGKLLLPKKLEMLNDSKLKSTKKSHAHKLGNDQWAYYDYLSNSGGFEDLPRYYKLGYDMWVNVKEQYFTRFKEFNLIQTDDYKIFRVVDSKKISN